MTDQITAWQGKRVFVLGDAMTDRTRHVTFSKMSPEVDGVRVYNVVRTEERPGAAANVAANIVALGGNVNMFCVEPMSVKERIVHDGKQVMRLDYDRIATTDEALVALEQFVRVLPIADIVILSDYAKGVLCDEVLIPAIKAAKAAGKIVIVDPKRKDWSAYTGADIITPNWIEWNAHTAGIDVSAGCIITCGKRGMSVHKPIWSTGLHIDGIPVEKPDVCGAGDTVVATLALGLSVGLGLYEAAKIANVAAAIAVSKPGTATVSADELRLRCYGNKVTAKFSRFTGGYEVKGVL